MNKTLIALGLVVLVVAGFFGYHAGANLGAQTVNYSNSLSNANLYNSLASIVQDLQAVRTPLSGVLSASPTIDFPSMIVSTSTATTTAVSGASVGDFVLTGWGTGARGVSLNGQVISANTVELTAFNASNTAAIDPASQTIYIRVVPQSSFAAPSALNTVTSTSN